MIFVDRIETDPEILLGKPVIRGTRIAVSFLLEALTSMSIDEILAAYPFLTRDDVEAALRYAALVVDSREGDGASEVSS
jgi:uncharacterized protein (DUF433 family)